MKELGYIFPDLWFLPKETLQLGISTYTFPWAIGIQDFAPTPAMTAVALLKTAKALGIHYVQFGDNLPLHVLGEKGLEIIREESKKLHIQLQVGTCGLSKENIQQYLVIAQYLGSPFLRVVIDDVGYEPDEQEVTPLILQMLPDFKAANVILAIENHDRFPAKKLKRIIEQTDKAWVGVCLDTANSLGAGEGIENVTELLAPYTVNLHIKDFTIQRLENKMGFMVQGCPAGKGMLDMAGLIEEIESHGRCKTATLEVWSNPEDTLAKTLEKEARWVEESIAFLKNISS